MRRFILLIALVSVAACSLPQEAPELRFPTTGELPREGYGKHFVEARARVMEKLQAWVAAHPEQTPSAGVERSPDKQEVAFLEAAGERVTAGGGHFTWNDLLDFQAEFIGQELPPPEPELDLPPKGGRWDEAYVQAMVHAELQGMFELEQPVGPPSTCDPVLLPYVQAGLYPGGPVGVPGVCLGESPGRLFCEIDPAGHVVEMEILSWSPTKIWARLAAGLRDLRPHRARLWVETAPYEVENDFGTWPIGAKTSNAIQEDFVPLYSKWTASTDISCWTPIGASETEVEYVGVTVQDPDFWIREVTSAHDGDGWSELRAPWAKDHSFAQGWHIGIDWIGSCTMTIHYYIYGPRGIGPPPTPEFMHPFAWVADVGPGYAP